MREGTLNICLTEPILAPVTKHAVAVMNEFFVPNQSGYMGTAAPWAYCCIKETTVEYICRSTPNLLRKRRISANDLPTRKDSAAALVPFAPVTLLETLGSLTATRTRFTVEMGR